MIYIVMGIRGEYSDRSEWSVCAYTDKALAEKHADEAMKWAYRKGKNGAVSPWDPGRYYYKGTDYYVLEVEIRDALPKEID